MAHHPGISTAQQQALRSWLRLLGSSNAIRKVLTARMQAAHGVSLSRFDILANLYRAPEGGVRLSDLSKQLMVSNGNVTQVMAPLMKEGLVERKPCADDARAAVARLTAEGRATFETMASEHAAWVEDIFTPLTVAEQENLLTLLDKLGTHAAAGHSSE
ncbi:MarR family winged helix-turn-helix transcriptional regulator [Kordiimonas gwangyangensis]|uniref:MarR family winged helix-turn-helix transcriptional regulator n=1 Tax=Kordiimonas gwangyangensis TaxID=288022 RepID=UPI00036DDEDC|nr:MarR family winged helix-turn-helix transcriptional regulator [Kordiimonas gwangyangensis]